MTSVGPEVECVMTNVSTTSKLWFAAHTDRESIPTLLWTRIRWKMMEDRSSHAPPFTCSHWPQCCLGDNCYFSQSGLSMGWGWTEEGWGQLHCQNNIISIWYLQTISKCGNEWSSLSLHRIFFNFCSLCLFWIPALLQVLWSEVNIVHLRFTN